MKKCCRCKEFMDVSMFSRDKTKHDGLQARCKACEKELNAAFRSRRPEYSSVKSKARYEAIGKHENKERYLKYKEDFLSRRGAELSSVRGRLYVVFSAARDRASKRGQEFDITLDWVVDQWMNQQGVCALTNVPLTLMKNANGERFNHPFNPSLDRIDSSGGYTKENTRLVCVMANLALNKFGDEAFAMMCHGFVEKNKAMQTLMEVVA